MEEHRYYIAIDENGEAYIEHGLFDRARSTGQRAHKYLMKIGEGAKARYLYTQEEVRAYMQGGRQAVKNAGRNAVNTIKDKVGVDEKERAEKAWDKVPKRLSKNDPKGMRDFKLASKAQDDYRKTPLGKAEYTAERAKEIATGQDGSAKEIAQKIGNNLKSKTDRMKEEFRKKKDEVADQKGTEHTVKDNNIPETNNKENEEIKLSKRLSDEYEKHVVGEVETKSDYKKKPDPTNSSGAINYDTLKNDAKEAGVDFLAYAEASKKVEKLARELMQESSKPKTGVQSLNTPMWYDDPAYKKAVSEKNKELEKLKKILYE